MGGEIERQLLKAKVEDLKKMIKQLAITGK